MYLIGTGLIGAALCSALVGALAYALVTTGRVSLLGWGRRAAWSALLLVVGVALLILVAFLQQRYDIRYVYDYSSSDLELRYRIAAVWAGQPGSLVVWALAGLLCAPLLIRRSRQFEPYVLAPLLLIQALLLLFVLLRNPFAPTIIDGVASQPADGRGLNPILHNVWMVIHPPTLFIGYGLLVVPFCLALAGLWRRDYDGWVRPGLTWTIAGWTVLGVALAMGGYWAYETLGWGGYWGWDPVENAALVPWLTGAALMHGLLVQRTHGGLRRTNMAMAILTYGCVFYASFLTRSGVLSSFSVHSFTEEGLKEIMLVSMIVLLAGSSLLLALRWRDVPSRPLSDRLLSRDTAFVLLIVAFVMLAALVSFGNSIPWFTSVSWISRPLQQWLGGIFEIDDGTLFNGQPLGDGRFSLTPQFFKQTTPPLGLILAILMAVGPLLGWRNTPPRRLLRDLRWPFAATVIITSGAMLLGVHDPFSVIYVLIASLAAGTNLLLIIRLVRSGWWRIGGYLAHVGMALFLLGVVGSYAYASPEEKIVLREGETQSILGHTFTFWGYEGRDNNRHVMRLTVDEGSEDAFAAFPELYFNERMGAWVRTPAIKRSLWKDLYIAPENYLPAKDANTAVLAPGESGTIGPYTIFFEGFDLGAHGVDVQSDTMLIGATLTITGEQQTQQLTPRLRLEPDRRMRPIPATLPDGRRVLLEAVSPAEELVRIRIEGLNLPVTPARAVFTVSTKPAIALVWLGVALMTAGGSIAVLRRQLDRRALRVPRAAPVPGALGGWNRRLRGWRGAS